MGNRRDMVRCKGDIARSTREGKKYASAHAYAAAIEIDPKTVRAIEAGRRVSLAKVQEYARHLKIPVEDLLAAEHLDAAEPIRIFLDLVEEHPFPVDVFEYVENEISYCAAFDDIAYPCDGTAITDLIGRMDIYPANVGASGKEERVEPSPTWKVAEGVRGNPELLNHLRQMSSSLDAATATPQSSLEGVLSALELPGQLDQLLSELGSAYHLHVLGLELRTDALEWRSDDDYVWVRVKVPLFVIAPTHIREAHVKYVRHWEPQATEHLRKLWGAEEFDRLYRENRELVLVNRSGGDQ